MATTIWRGSAQAVAQVTTVTIGGTAAIGQVYSVTIGTKTLSFTAANTSNSDIATGLQAVLAASTIPEFAEITWTVASAVVTGTAATPGKPFTLSSGATGTGSATASTTTANSGPNCWDVALNWDTEAVPVDGDDVVLERSSIGIYYGLGQSSVDLVSLTIDSTYTGDIGLPDYASSGYFEYRARKLAIGATTVTIGQGSGAGSGRIRLNLGTGQTAVTVHNTGVSRDANTAALQLEGTHASNTLSILKGDVGSAVAAGETATWATIRTGYIDSENTDVRLQLGAGCTLTTLTLGGGQVTTQSALTTVTMTGGTLTHLAGTITTLTVDAGTVYYQSSGTLTTGTFRTKAARLDVSRDLRARTITNLTVTKGASLHDPEKTITFTNPYTTDRESLLASDLGAQFSLQRS